MLPHIGHLTRFSSGFTGRRTSLFMGGEATLGTGAWAWDLGTGYTASVGLKGSDISVRDFLEMMTRGQEILLTLAAWGPFCPWTISNSTLSPSCRLL
jgi:hypothetical protein